MAGSINLTDPKDKEVEVIPADVVMVFFSPMFSPTKARSNVVYDGVIWAFRETTKQAVAQLEKHIKLLKLTFAEGGSDVLNRDVWVNIAKIHRVNAAEKGGAVLKLNGQQGTLTVVETKEYVDAAVKQPAVA